MHQRIGLIVAGLSALIAMVATPLASHATTSSAWHVQRTTPLLLRDGALNSVSCSGPHRCHAVGFTQIPGEADCTLDTCDGYASAFAMDLDGNGGNNPLSLPLPADSHGTTLDAIACSGAHHCLAVGAVGAPTTLGLRTLSSQPIGPYVGNNFARLLTPHGWTSPSLPSYDGRTALLGASCADATHCLTVGIETTDADGTRPIAVSLTAAGLVDVAVPAPSNSNEYFQSVSCTTATSCTAVGVASGEPTPLIETWNGSSWTAATIPANTDGALSSVSCPTATSCVAVGSVPNGRPFALTQRDSVWSVSYPRPPHDAQGATLSEVSCAGADDCTAVGGVDRPVGTTIGPQSFITHWDGTRWTRQDAPVPVESPWSTLQGISCTSATACLATGSTQFVSSLDSRTHTLVEQWDGTSWTIESAPQGSGRSAGNLATVSCPTATWCLSLGFDSESLTTDNIATLAMASGGDSWFREPFPKARVRRLDAVSCWTVDRCLAVGEDLASHRALAETWDGQHWTPVPIHVPHRFPVSALTAVSCRGGSACIAIGSGSRQRKGSTLTAPLVERWNGRQLSVQKIGLGARQDPTALTSISCINKTHCTAVGAVPPASSQGRSALIAETWKGSVWTQRLLPWPVTADADQQGQDQPLQSVSCSAARACIAVGTDLKGASPDGLALVESHGTWTSEPLPLVDPNLPEDQIIQLGGVSCAAASSCEAVGWYDLDGGSRAGALLEHWDGASWTRDIEPDLPDFVQLSGVSCPTVTKCSAVGQIRTWNTIEPLVESS